MFSYLAVVVGDSEPGVLWLICSREEAVEKVFPRLTPQEAFYWMEWYSFNGVGANLSQSDSRAPAEELVVSEGFHPSHLGPNAVTFLVSADGRDIVPHWPFYPFSGLWNGDSPFLLTKLQVVNALDELAAPEILGPLPGLSDWAWEQLAGKAPAGTEVGSLTKDYLNQQRKHNGSHSSFGESVTWEKRISKMRFIDSSATSGRENGSARGEKDLRRAAKRGSLKAKVKLGNSVLHSPSKSRRLWKYLREAAEARHPGTLNSLGVWMARQGRPEEAQLFWQAAAEEGNPDAHRNLAELARAGGEAKVALEWEEASQSLDRDRTRKLPDRYGLQTLDPAMPSLPAIPAPRSVFEVAIGSDVTETSTTPKARWSSG